MDLKGLIGKLLTRTILGDASSPSALPYRPPTALRHSIMIALEPRVVFDGALVPTIDAAADAPEHADDTASADDNTADTHATDQAGVAAPPARIEIAFIDRNIRDVETLAAAIDGKARIVWLDPAKDGVVQIGEVLAQYERVDAVHIYTHATATDGLSVGATTLTAANVDAYQANLAAWGQHLSADADILIYGCDLAADSSGQALVDDLARLTGADVAASSDLTGAQEHGGDWDLEYRSGVVETAVLSSADFSGVMAAPSISGWDSATINPTAAQAGYVLIDSSVTLTSGLADYDGWSLKVTASVPSEDLLSIRNQGNGAGQIGTAYYGAFPPYGEVYLLNYSGNTVAFYYYTGGAATGAELNVLLFAGTNNATVEAIIENLTYRNTASGAPTTTRTISLEMVNSGGSTGPLSIIETEENGQNGVSGMDSATGVTMSPDGKHLYVTASGSDSIAIFTRNTTTGEVTYSSMVVNGSGGVTDMPYPVGIDVSPDGKHVYVNDWTSRKVNAFSRDGTTGALTFIASYTNVTTSPGGDIIISDDGTTVYASQIGGLTVYTRNATTGALTLSASTTFISSGGGNSPELVVSPDGKHAYYAWGPGYFKLLTYNSVANTVTSSDISLPAGYENLEGLTMSPDGAYVYVTSIGSDAIVVYSRNATTGALTQIANMQNNQNGVVGMDGPKEIRITDDGTTAFVATTNSNNLLVFSRDPATGLLTYANQLNNSNFGGTSDMFVTPDGSMIYLVEDGFGSSALTVVGYSTGGSADSMDASITLTLADPRPMLTNWSPGTIDMTAAQAGYVLIDASVDLASGYSSYTGWRLVLTSNTLGQDNFSVRNQGTGAGQIGVSGSTITYGGTTIGSLSGGTGGAPLSIILMPGATTASIEALIENLTYRNTGTAGAVVPSRELTLSLLDPAANGALSYVGQVKDGSGGVDGLAGALDLVTSGDGKFVYAIAPGDSAVSIFSRNITTGVLTYVGQVKNGVNGITNFTGQTAIAISDDGKNVYVTVDGAAIDGSADGIHTFSRNATTGELTFVAFRDATVNTASMAGLKDIVVSADGKFVYTVNSTNPAWYSRDAVTGALTFIGFYGLGGTTEDKRLVLSPDGNFAHIIYGGSGGIYTMSRNATTGALTYNSVWVASANATDITVAPDGAHVYVTAANSLRLYTRNTGTGALTLSATYTDNAGGVDGLQSARDVVVSADGNYVYVAGTGESAIAVFSRNVSTGQLTYQGVIKDTAGTDGLAGVRALAVSANGGHVYGAGATDSAVAVLKSNLGDGLQMSSSLTLQSASNDPAGTSATHTINEDSSYTFSAGSFGFTDADGHTFANVRIDTLPVNGTLRLSGVAVTAGQVIAAAQFGNLTFTPAANANGAGYASFTFSVQDSSGAFDPSPNTLTFNVTAVNDTPTGADFTKTINEDSTYTFSAADFGFSDVDAGDSLSAVRFDTVPANGTILYLGAFPVTAGNIVNLAQLSSLTYVPAANANGVGYASFTFSVADQSGVYDTAPNTATFNVTPVNDAPTGADRTVTINEDASHVFTAAEFGFSDVDAGDSLSAVRIDSLPVNGTLTLSGVAVTAGQVISAANIGNLVFTPAANANGNAYASFTFSVRDQAGAFDAAPNTVTVDVTAVNDAPTGADRTVTINEDTGHTFAAAEFGFSDVDAGDSLSAVRIDSLPVNGTLTLSGVAVTAGQVISAANIGNLVFTPAADANGTGYATFTFSVRDQANAFDASPNTITVNVTPVADLPAVTNWTGTVTIGENTANAGWVIVDNDVTVSGNGNYSFTIGISTSSDSGTDRLSIRNQGAGAGQIGVSGNTITYEGAAIGTLVYGSNDVVSGHIDLVIKLNGAASNAAVEALLENIQYRNTSDNPEVSRTLDIRFEQGGLEFVSDVNATMRDIWSDGTYYYGVSGSISAHTYDGTNLTMITQDGIWPAMSPDRVVGDGTYIYAMGDEGIRAYSFNGTSFTLHDTYTTAAVANMHIEGGFIFAARKDGVVDVLTFDGNTFTSVDTAPLLGDGRAAWSDGSYYYVTSTGGIQAFGFDGSALTLLSSYPLGMIAPSWTGIDGADGYIYVATGGPFLRAFSFDGSSFTDAGVYFDGYGQAVSDVDVKDGKLFVSIGGSGLNVMTFDGSNFTVESRQDGHEGHSGLFVSADNTVFVARWDLQSSIYRYTETTEFTTLQTVINVTAENDVPTGADNSVTLDEDTSYSFAAADFGFSDVDNGDSLSGVRIDSLPLNGTLTLSGAAVTAGQVISAASLGNLVFTPAANDSGNAYASFTFSVRDQAGAFDDVANTMTIDVTPVNETPTGADNTVTIDEDTAHTFAVADFGFSDGDVGDSLSAVRIDSLPVNGTLTLSGAAVTAGQVITAANIGNLLFTPAANANGNAYASFTFSVRDQANAFDASANTMTIDVTPVNDAPTGADNTLTINEDTAHTFAAADFGFSDIDAGDSLSAVRIDSLPLNGTLTLSGAAVTAGQVITAANIGNLLFTPAANANGNAYASFTFSVRDQANAFDASANTMTVDVTTVNDAPTGADNTVTINEDITHVFAVADFGFSDIDAGDSLSAVRIDSLPLNGTLTLSGAAVTAGQVITAANLGNLVFTPAANANGNAYASFTFSVRDQANAFDASANTMTIDVTPVNDAPTGTNNTLTMNEDASHSFAGAHFGFSDVDGGDSLSAVRIDSLPLNGALTLSGVAVTAGQVISAANIGNLVFTPVADANGMAYASFTFSVRDQANVFAAGANTITINVTPMADGPTMADDMFERPPQQPAPVAVVPTRTTDTGEAGTIFSPIISPMLYEKPKASWDVDALEMMFTVANEGEGATAPTTFKSAQTAIPAVTRAVEIGQVNELTMDVLRPVNASTGILQVYEIRMQDGSAAPEWLRVDHERAVIMATPPAAAAGVMDILLVVKNQTGERFIPLRLNVQQEALSADAALVLNFRDQISAQSERFLNADVERQARIFMAE